MSFRSSPWLPIALALTVLVPTAAYGQPDDTAPAAKVPRTPSGAPDLQGIWDFRTITPLERPTELADKEFLTAEEAAEFERATVARRHKDNREGGAASDVARAYNHFWWDYGTNAVETRRTSLIIDPPDGQVPVLTPDGQRRAETRRQIRQRIPRGPEDLGVSTRCILGFNAGPPMRPSAYNNNVLILQTEDYVVIHTEMVHDTRIVPLDGRPHIPAHIRQWRGDSRGHWDGDTLVVETRNFTDQTSYRGSGPAMKLTERFIRVGERSLLYRFTVDDQQTFVRPFTVEVPMRPLDGEIYEYACHDRNYGMFGILSGARFEEREAEKAKHAKSQSPQ